MLLKNSDILDLSSLFKISNKELLALPGMANQLRFLTKSDRNLGPRKEIWCDYHKAFRYDVEHCITLGYQLAGLVKDGFLKEYLEGNQETPKEDLQSVDQRHEVHVHGEINTISGGGSASQRMRYTREVMIVEGRELDQSVEPKLCFTKDYLRDVILHEDDLVVISLVTVGRRVHRVFIDQGCSADMMFWRTFNKLQLSLDQLRPYDGCLFGFPGDQVKVTGHVELRTTFSYGISSQMTSIRYLVVSATSAYNILLSRLALNRLGTVASTRHMKMKLPSLEGGVIVIKYN